MSSTPTIVPPVSSPSALRLDDGTLTELGFGDLPPEARADLLLFLVTKLETAVGARVAHNISSKELLDLDVMLDREDRSAALVALDLVFLEHPTIASEELERLLGQLRAEQPVFLAAFSMPKESA